MTCFLTLPFKKKNSIDRSLIVSSVVDNVDVVIIIVVDVAVVVVESFIIRSVFSFKSCLRKPTSTSTSSPTPTPAQAQSPAPTPTLSPARAQAQALALLLLKNCKFGLKRSRIKLEIPL